MDDKKRLLRALPKVDECIDLVEKKVSSVSPSSLIKIVIQKCIETERRAILNNEGSIQQKSLDEWCDVFLIALKKKQRNNLRKVINGSGVVIHTNLGRSLLSKVATDRLLDAGAHYTNLEFNLQTGKRGSRYSLVEDIICELTGAEAALVVNNNAAAVLLVLDSLAKGKEAIVSRGQLVEIGGSFRIPDVMAKSGAKLVEVGATNRTHLKDYEDAITDNTALLLKVHTSNFRIIGFTSEVPAAEMVELVKGKEISVMEDLGSGCLVDLSSYGLPKEPTVQEVVRSGVDVVTFSGDKLLGGPQSGIIVGKKKIIDRIKKNPLNRALRIDKFTLATLESTFRNYYDLPTALSNIPTLAMLTQSSDQIKKRSTKVFDTINEKVAEQCKVELVPTVSRVGGGALPEYSLESWAIELQPAKVGVNVLEKQFRKLNVPIIGRIENEKFLIDFRTVQDQELNVLSDMLIEVFTK
ncbi:MAG: L-seryl-tRNA(Sec) selenium transferase [Bacteroidetes bacterium]|nr:L-seryl-tRNA(Sec) selenium transferase [Bacteroidota bacterium]